MIAIFSSFSTYRWPFIWNWWSIWLFVTLLTIQVSWYSFHYSLWALHADGCTHPWSIRFLQLRWFENCTLINTKIADCHMHCLFDWWSFFDIKIVIIIIGRLKFLINFMSNCSLNVITYCNLLFCKVKLTLLSILSSKMLCIDMGTSNRLHKFFLSGIISSNWWWIWLIGKHLLNLISRTGFEIAWKLLSFGFILFCHFILIFFHVFGVLP